MEELVLFILCFLLVFIIYEIFVIGPVRKSKGKRQLFEVKYLLGRYSIPIKDINYNRLLHICGFTSSLDIALIVSFMELIDNFWLKVIGTFIFSLAIIMISYHIVYLIIRRK